MSINIICGKCSEDSLLHIFQVLKNRDKTKSNYIIAPDRSLFSIERRLFDELDEECFFDLSVMSFSKLSKKILTNCEKNILTKQSGVALVKKLLIENKDNLHTFGKATDFMGFATSLFETICLFKSCNISPQEISVDDSSDYLNLKQKDIRLIYEKYEEFLQKDYTDSFNQLKLFAKMIDKNTFANTNFYFVEFDDFTALMYEIIAKIGRFNNIYICTTFGKENNNSNIYTNKVYYDLIDLFKFEGLDFAINKLENNDVLTNNLLAYVPKKSNKSNNITITSFDQKSDEIKYVVADIYSRVLRCPNADFGQFTIVLPDFGGYKEELECEFNKYQIPFYFDQNDKLIDYSVIRLIFDICNLFDGRFLSSDILNIVKSSLLNFSLEQVCDYDNYLRKTGRKGLACLNCDILEEKEIIDFLNKIEQWHSLSKEYTKVAEFYEIIEEIYDYIISRGEEFFNSFSPIEKRILEQVKNKFNNIKNDYIAVFGDSEVSFNEFLETYKSYFESSDISLPPITSNTIFVADLDNSYISKTKYLYILGCNEGKCPSFKMDNGLISDEEIAKFPNAKKINPTINLLNSRKTFKLFDIMHRASEHTYLSFYLSSSDGVGYPNNLIKSVVNIYNQDIVNGSNKLDFVTNSLHNLDINNIAFNNMSKEIVVDNVLTMTKNWRVYSKYPNYRQILSMLVKNLNDKNIYNLIANDELLVKKLKISDGNMFANNATSISQIETYYNCPYKHFARYGLKINKRKDYQLQPNDIGTIVHSILKDLMSDILCGKQLEDIYNKSDSLLETLLNSSEYINFVNNPINSYVIVSLKKELYRIIEGISNQLEVSSYRPNIKYLEYKFATNNLSKYGVSLRGTIDRVDIWDNNFIIIDYKTGDSHFDNYTDVFSGKKLQLLVYAKCFASKTGLLPKGVFYLPISNAFGKEKPNYKLQGVLDGDINNIYAMDNGLTQCSYDSKIINLHTTQSGEFAKNSAFFSKMCIDKDSMEYLLDFTINQVDRAIKNILDGDITPHPLKTNNKNVCEFCEYMGLCNYQKNNDRCVGNIATIEQLKERG